MGDLTDTVLTCQWALSSPSARGTHRGLGLLGKGLCPERGAFEGGRGQDKGRPGGGYSVGRTVSTEVGTNASIVLAVFMGC